MQAEPTPSPLTPMPAEIAAALARRFERVVVFSGAGLSAESGIPTFRSGSNGLWSEFDPSELATPIAFERDPDLVWGWYEWRRGLIQRARPNAGHEAAARLQKHIGASIVTQNVDDLLERAGAAHVLHLHGRLDATRCLACDAPVALRAPMTEVPQRVGPPRCTSCGGLARPGVVWFGEGLPARVVDDAADAIRTCDLLLVVGTSGVVQPAASLAGLAPDDATVIVVNPDAQAGGRPGRLHWLATAASALPAIADALIPKGRR